MRSRSLWNYYRDELNHGANENDNANNKINNNKTITSKSFEYKTKMIGRAPDNTNTLDREIVFRLKYLSNFWRFLDLSLINSKIEHDLLWSKECIISELSITPEVRRNNLVDAIQTTGAIFQINDAKLYVLVVTLSVNDNSKFLENIKQGFKRTISWNKYRSEITAQPKNNNSDYLIDPTFRNINRLFVR